jgi:hypothetical protein
MIRPLTVATFLMACGSGLYLYQSKHEVQMLDRTIEKTVHDSEALREQSRLLAAEWTMLNDPDRLRQFSDTYLNLKTINPAQFTSLADLDAKLPTPRVEVSSSGSDETPVAAEAEPQPMPEPPQGLFHQEALPVPPAPAVHPAQPTATNAHPSENKVAAARPVIVEAPARAAAVAEPRPSEQRVPEQRLSEQRPGDQRPSDQRGAARSAEAHPEPHSPAAPPRPIVLAAPKAHPVDDPPVAAPVRPASSQPVPPAPFGGSLLGMAHGSMPPAPRPTPVNAAYNAN